MKLINKLFCFTCLLVLVSLFSCKDDEEPEKTKTELLTQNWKLIKLTANGSDQPTDSSESEILLNGGPDKFLINSLTDTHMTLTINQTNYKAGAVALKMEFGL